METYEVLKYLHIVCAIIWLGGATMFNVMAAQLLTRKDPRELSTFGERVEWFGKFYFTPFSLLVLLFGASMVGESDVWSFSDGWIVAGLGGIVSTIVIGAGFLGPASGRMAKAIAGGAPADQISAQISRIVWIARIDLAVLFLVVADMVFKPGV